MPLLCMYCECVQEISPVFQNPSDPVPQGSQYSRRDGYYLTSFWIAAGILPVFKKDEVKMHKSTLWFVHLHVG